MIKHSVFIKIGAWFAALYILYSIAFIAVIILSQHDRYNELQYKRASAYSRVGRILLKDGDTVELNDRLQAAADDYEIGFYVIRKANEELFSQYNSASLKTRVENIFKEKHEEGIDESASLTRFLIRENGFTLEIGFESSLWFQARAYISEESSNILKDIGFVLILVISIVLYAFRDFRAILGRLRRPGFDRTDLNLAHSSETMTLIQGLKGYQESSNALVKENALLKGQVLPALQNELRSHEHSPFEFGCTLVRTDINNFTSVFSGEKRGIFMDIINDFFVGVAHIASRYGGFIYEFIGDEVIFYLKDDDHANAAAMALSAVRDINLLAEQFNLKTEQQHSFSFKIKSSLSHGDLRFGPQVNGYSLAGTPLIETVRMLSHIHEKSSNTVLFDDSVFERVRDLASSEEFGLVTLKGISEPRRLHRYLEHQPLRRQLTTDLSLTTFYRSDENICEILDWLCKNYELMDQKKVVSLLGGFQSYKVPEVSLKIQSSYVRFMDLLLEMREGYKTEFALSALVSAARNLFPPNAFSGPVRERMLRCLNAKTRRVLANTVDVFIELDPGAGEDIFDRLIDHDDNRITGNALVKQAKRELNKKTLRRLKTLLKSPSPFYRASAIYALTEIASHLKQLDEVAYRTNSELQRLLDQAAREARHENPMIQRQALRLAEKTSRQELARVA
jgi:class 3 adenylate cyclase